MKTMIVSKVFMVLAALAILAGAGVANAGLVLYYDFDETTGTVAADKAAAIANDGTLSGTDFTFDNASVTGKYGSALDLGYGIGDVIVNIYTEAGDGLPGALEGGNNFTVSMWIKTDNWGQGGVIFAYGRADIRFTIGLNTAGGVPEVQVYSKTLNGDDADVLLREQLPVPGINASEWHHIAVSVAETVTTGGIAADPTIYVDGSSLGGTATTSAWTTDPISVLGRRQSSTKKYYNGYIDEFAIFNTTFSSEEVNAIYTSGAPIPEPASMLLLGLGGLALVRRKK